MRYSGRHQVGFTHLAVDVDDMHETIALLEKVGGTVIQSTRTKVASGEGTAELVFVADPDGVRVELVSQP